MPRDYSAQIPITDLDNDDPPTFTSIENENSHYDVQPHRRTTMCFIARCKLIILVVVVALAALALGLIIGFTASRSKASSAASTSASSSMTGDGDPTIAEKLQKEITPDNIRKYLKDLTAKPHLAGTQADRKQAEDLVNFWKGLHFETYLHKYNVQLSYPDKDDPNVVQLVNSSGDAVFSSALAEQELLNLPDGADVVAPYNAYAAAGSPQTNRLVYVNYGRAEDFEWLVYNKSVNLTGTIAIAKYGYIFRGNKVEFAEKYGCAGLVLYSDPADYTSRANDTTFPDTVWLPETAVQRGTVARGLAGDPLTPGYPAIESAYRLKGNDHLPTIPVQPISYRDARKFLEQLGGEEAPEDWRGDLNITYRIGPGLADPDMTVRLHVSTRPERRDTYNAMAILKGAVEPDRYVLVGNHRDAWVFGAVDPSSGTAAMKELSRAIAKLAQDGWKPRRSIVFLSWGAEEFGLVGSTEWAEQYISNLANRAVAYLNVDIAVQGNYSLRARSSPLLRQALYDAAQKVANPNPAEVEAGRTTVYDTWLHSFPDKLDTDRPEVKAMGSGSDFKVFNYRVGVSCLQFRYTYNSHKYQLSSYPLYHSAYETFFLVDSLMDRGFKYHAAVAGLWGELARRLAESAVLPLGVAEYGATVKRYVDDTVQQHGDELKAQGLGKDLEFLQKASERFDTATEDFAEKLKNVDKKDALAVRRVNDQMMLLERSFIDPLGLPGRPFVRHVISAPGSRNQYQGGSFPGLADTLYGMEHLTGAEQDQRWDKVKKELARLSFFIQAGASTLDDVTEFKDAVE